MNGIIVINKPKNYTSRDIVNIVAKKLNTPKVGHTGTLDPLATGVLVIPVGRALKISELLSSETKEYRAKAILGYETDMLDVTGTIQKQNKPTCTKEEIEAALNSFLGTTMQEVPAYSAVKINGKKLYEYARNGIKVPLPTHEIKVYSIKLTDNPVYLRDTIEFTFECTVSKGTYIRGLIRDIGYKLNTYGTMKELTRTRQGSFTLEMASSIEDIAKDNYHLLTIREALPNLKVTKIDDKLLKKIKNGMIVDSFFQTNLSLLVDKEGREIAIYQNTKDGKAKPYKMIEV